MIAPRAGTLLAAGGIDAGIAVHTGPALTSLMVGRRHAQVHLRDTDNAMAARTTFDEPPEFDVGDRVLLVAHIGPVFRPRLRRGDRGIVTGRSVTGQLTVRFDNGSIEIVSSVHLRLDPEPRG
jgi:hypothetical protein